MPGNRTVYWSHAGVASAATTLQQDTETGRQSVH